MTDEENELEEADPKQARGSAVLENVYGAVIGLILLGLLVLVLALVVQGIKWAVSL